MRIDQIKAEVVDLAPKVLEPGRLYISHKYRAAVHLCCCGCGEKVVTPLSPAEWQVHVQNERVTLHPSIGNWSMTCQSHYLIRDSRVIWAGTFSKKQMTAVFERDQRDLKRLHQTSTDRPTPAPSVPPKMPTNMQPDSRGWLGWLKELWLRLTR